MRGQLAAAIAMSTGVGERLFTPQHLASVEAQIKFVDTVPLTTFSGPHADEVLAGTQVLITGWGCPPLTAEVLDRAPLLEYVLHAGGTVKEHITDDVWARGIKVSSAALANSIPVAEYTLAMIIMANKKILHLSAAYTRQRTQLAPESLFPGLGNYGKTVGLIGASKIGRLVLEKLQNLDLRVLVADPYMSPEEAHKAGAELTDLDTLLSHSDVVSLHAPALPETRNLLDGRRIEMLRPGSTLINTARGCLVDQDALRVRVQRGDLFAILDVTTPWVLDPDDALFDHPNVLLTPHIAGSMGSELQRLSAAALNEAVRIASGQELLFPVTAADLARIA